jgi:hypothetical protein
MRITTGQPDALAGQLPSAAPPEGGGFEKTLFLYTQTMGPAAPGTPADRQAAAASADAATEAAFQDFVHTPPMKRMREQILKELHLTEEDLAKLPPKEREAMEKAITAKIKERMQAAAEAKATKATAKLLHRL